MKKRIKVILTLVILGCMVWFLIVSPLIQFHRNEKSVEKAGKRYFDLNQNELPTGERVKTLSLKKLYFEKLLENDIFAPYTRKTCSLEKSWVKVKREENDYQYYVYLDCGILKSSVDAKGPVIRLKGKEKITLGVGDQYEDPGISSVVDDVDGKLNTSDVNIKGKVDTSKVGVYEITYSAYDKLSNAGVATRTVSVVKKAYNTFKKDLGKETNYKGMPTNNYVRLSNMVFAVYGIDENKNIVLVADKDVANVSYNKINDWLKYYYQHFTKKSKSMIVPSKYCNMKVDESNLNTTECTSYTKERNVYIPSIVEVNKAAGDYDSFMKPVTMSWLSTSQDSKKAYLTRNVFYGSDYEKSFVAYDITENYGVRPMLTIKGSTLITGGDGSYANPYTFGDSEPAKGSSLLNTRDTGEYISDGSFLWRIVDVMKDGTTKAISEEVITLAEAKQDSLSERITYNPKDKTSVGYYINNKVSEFVDTSKLVNHQIEVPIYQNKIIYGEESTTKKYNVVLSAPNMFEMFSAAPSSTSSSYWFLNTSLENGVGAALTEIGVPYNDKIGPYTTLSVRVVGYFKDSTIISTGKGTENSPYVVK